VYYYVENKDKNHNLIIKTEKTKKFAYKLGLHYDNEMSAGIIANMTARNLFFNASRFITTIDISDNPKIRTAYQVYIGNKGFYLSTNHFFEYVKQPVFYERKTLGFYKNLFEQSDIMINYAISQNSALSGGIQFKWGNLKPQIKPSERPDLFKSLFTLSKRPYLNSSIVLKYAYNSFNQQTFPTKGKSALIQSEFVFAGKTSTSIHTESIVIDSNFNTTNISDDTTIRHSFSPYFKLYGTYEHIFRLHKKVSLDARIDMGMIFLFRPSKKDFANQQADAFYVGGTEPRERERTTSLIPFWGNRDLYVQNLNFLTASVSIQYEAIKNLFFIPKVSVFMGDDGNINVYGNRAVISNLKDNKLLFAHSEGITIAYKTPVGPVRFNISKASNYAKPTFYFSLGYRI
jgi:outer membrane protein assembly factor BamA